MPLSFQMCVVPAQGHAGSQGTEAGRVRLCLHVHVLVYRRTLTSVCGAPLGFPLLFATAVPSPWLPRLNTPLHPQDAQTFLALNSGQYSSARVRNHSSPSCHVIPLFFSLWPRFIFSAALFISPVKDIHFNEFISRYFFLCSFRFFLSIIQDQQ